MTNDTPRDEEQKSSEPILPEETIQALIKLGMLLRRIAIRENADKIAQGQVPEFGWVKHPGHDEIPTPTQEKQRPS